MKKIYVIQDYNVVYGVALGTEDEVQEFVNGLNKENHTHYDFYEYTLIEL